VRLHLTTYWPPDAITERTMILMYEWGREETHIPVKRRMAKVNQKTRAKKSTLTIKTNIDYKSMDEVIPC
jgi:hypothetical protein